MRAKTSRTLKTEYTFNRYIKKYEPSSPVAKAYAEFAKEEIRLDPKAAAEI